MPLVGGKNCHLEESGIRLGDRKDILS